MVPHPNDRDADGHADGLGQRSGDLLVQSLSHGKRDDDPAARAEERADLRFRIAGVSEVLPTPLHQARPMILDQTIIPAAVTSDAR